MMFMLTNIGTQRPKNYDAKRFKIAGKTQVFTRLQFAGKLGIMKIGDYYYTGKIFHKYIAIDDGPEKLDCMEGTSDPNQFFQRKTAYKLLSRAEAECQRLKVPYQLLEVPPDEPTEIDSEIENRFKRKEG